MQNGPQVAEGLSSSGYSTPVIVSTEDAAEMANDHAPITYMQRPIQPATLQRTLIQALRESKKHTDQSELDTTSTIPLRILLAEDNPVNQKVANRILAKLGYNIDIVDTGQKALTAARTGHYDVIFMDVQMPEMDGLDATRAIRRDPSIAQQPYIIAMTAAAMQMDREKCIDAGMDDFVSKPTRVESLVSALDRSVTHIRNTDASPE